MLDELDDSYLQNLELFKKHEVKNAYKKFSCDKGIVCVTDFTLYKWATGKSRPTAMNRELVKEFFNLLDKKVEGGE